ncbi:TonB-dependent receptor [Phenylobacterium sp. LjRoot225]|uniref:TonB-dependent receptor n=1 Tax=Phenylobacterium sp. LjRoot225 TaxID=3342285 RepID=UPI003ED04372
MTKRILLMTAAVALAHAGAAAAQDQGEATVTEVVVTAQKRSERLIDVPMSVSAVSGEALAQAGITSTVELSQSTPGLVTVNNGFGFVPVIRGVQSSGTSPGDESNVALYLDDISIGTPIAGFFDLADIERIEVLKGPQGTLFGRNATGGAIRIVTRRPSFTPQGSVSADYGFRYDEVKLGGYLTGPLSDKVAGSLSGVLRKGDGYIKGIGPNVGKTYAKPDNYVVRGKLLFEPSDVFNAMLSADSWQSRNDITFISMVPAGTNPFPQLPGTIPNGPYTFAGSTEPRARVKGDGLSLDANWEPSKDVTVRSITGYREAEVHSQAESDRTSQSLAANQISQYQKSFSEEINVSGPADEAVSWLIGAFYYNSLASNPYFRQYAGDAPGGTIVTNFTNRMRSIAYAGFADLTWNATEKLHLTLGGRYSSETKTFRYRDLVKPAGQALMSTDTRKTWNSFTYRAVGRYDFADDANVYASFSNGFKSGVYNAYSFIPNPVDPEKIKAFEVGAKARLQGVTFTAAAYAYKYKDIQLSSHTTINGLLLVALSNAAKAKMRGVEFTADGRLTDHLSFNAGVGYQPTAKYQDYTRAQVTVPIPGATGQGTVAQLVVPFDASGSRMTRAPKVTANLRLNYNTSLMGGEFLGTVSGSYNSGFYWQPGNLSHEGAYTVVNSRLSWTEPKGRLTYSLWANNLTDEVYRIDVTPNVLAGDSFKVPPKRQIGVGVEFEF